jgi:hypothetical protein
VAVYLAGMTGPIGQLVEGSESPTYCTDMCINFERCLFCYDNDMGVVAKFKMLLQNIPLMSQ